MANERIAIYTDTTGLLPTGFLPTSVTTLTGSQTLTNKTISGASNTITNIGQSAVTNGYVDLSSAQTVAGVKTFSANPVVNATSSTAQLAIQRIAGQEGRLTYRTGTSDRWRLYTSASSESGSNAGSNFVIGAYADDGSTLVANAITITRSTGAVSLSTPLPIASGGTGSATQNFVDLTNTQTITGTKTLQSTLFVTATASARSIIISSDAGFERKLGLRTGSIDRWDFTVTSTVEAGSNTGSNLAIRAYDDAGTVLYTPISIARSTGSITMGRSIRQPITSSTISITLSDAHGTVLGDATSGNLIFTLPTAVSAAGVIYRIKKIDATANTITIQAAGAETIDGSNTNVISTQNVSRTIQSSGTAWYIL